MKELFGKINVSISSLLLTSAILVLGILSIDLIQTRYDYASELISITKNNNGEESLITEYQEIAKRYNMDLSNTLRYGDLLLKNEYNEAATAYYRQYLTHQFSPEVVFRLARTYFVTQQYDSSKSYFESLHYLSPTKFRPLYYLSKAYYASGEDAKADSLAFLIINKEPKINSPEIMKIKEAMKTMVLE